MNNFPKPYFLCLNQKFLSFFDMGRFLGLLWCYVLLTKAVVFSKEYVEREDRVDYAESYLLQSGHYTTGRRNPGVPQLHCISGDCSQIINQVLCTNLAYGRKSNDANLPIWDCLIVSPIYDPPLRFTTADLSCEGYHDSNDPKFLIGSCGLEYSLPSQRVTKPHSTEQSANLWIWLFLFLGFVISVIFGIYFLWRETRTRTRTYRSPSPPSPPYQEPVPPPMPGYVPGPTTYVYNSRRRSYGEGLLDGMLFSRSGSQTVHHHHHSDSSSSNSNSNANVTNGTNLKSNEITSGGKTVQSLSSRNSGGMAATKKR
jgi:hypothetical protein